MAKSNDITDKVLSLGIIAGVVIGLWVLYKWVKNHLDGNGGDTWFGASKEPSAGNGTNPGIPAPVKNIGQTISDAYKKEIGHPSKIIAYAYGLELANKSAKKYRNKPGSDVVINKALKAVNSLPDADFMAVINEWQRIDKFKEVLDTDLASAKILTNARSLFLTRYGRLTGKIGAIVTPLSSGLSSTAPAIKQIMAKGGYHAGQ